MFHSWKVERRKKIKVEHDKGVCALSQTSKGQTPKQHLANYKEPLLKLVEFQ